MCLLFAIGRQYTWIDERGKKIRLSAPQYIDYVMTYAQRTVNDEGIFPTKFGKLAFLFCFLFWLATFLTLTCALFRLCEMRFSLYNAQLTNSRRRTRRCWGRFSVCCFTSWLTCTIGTFASCSCSACTVTCTASLPIWYYSIAGSALSTTRRRRSSMTWSSPYDYKLPTMVTFFSSSSCCSWCWNATFWTVKWGWRFVQFRDRWLLSLSFNRCKRRNAFTAGGQQPIQSAESTAGLGQCVRFGPNNSHRYNKSFIFHLLFSFWFLFLVYVCGLALWHFLWSNTVIYSFLVQMVI